ncbi:MAG: heme lyase CcmF/NrfE family subunit, partial [Pseudomonadota bacterium]
MIVELGQFCLALALALAIAQSTIPLIGAHRHRDDWMAVAEPAAMAQFAAVLASFAILMHAYIVSDFSVNNVWQNSHSAKPLIYKISGTWGNHEGSMLLWVLILALFGAMVALFGKGLPAPLRARTLAVQGMIGVGFIAFTLFTSNPFLRIEAPLDGRGLNPLLQDPGLALHPPLLYIGYVGFSLVFSFAAAALIGGQVDAAWGRWVRPWALAAWCGLTAGIALGSYWAYYELGWGGWWFWDPVENASFMPWLTGTALLHSAIVVEKRDSLKSWTILLAITTFGLSLLGTFLVRSGVLTSVHAFAVDPARGVFILILMALAVGGSLSLYAARAPRLGGGGLFQPISREGALVFNNLFLAAAAGTVLIGTLYPLMLDAVGGGRVSVGPPFFNLTVVPMMVPLVAAVGVGPLLSWKRADLAGALGRLKAAAVICILAALGVGYLAHGGPVLAVLGVGLAFWCMAAAISELAERIKLGRLPISQSLSRLTGLPRSA